MYELILAGESCYYIDCPAKIGVVKLNDSEVVLIDSGNDKDAGKKIKKILDGQGWSLKAVYNTHSHADHIGGNKYLQTQTGCRVYAYGAEYSFVENPILEPSFLYGGNPPKELRHKFLVAEPSIAEKMTEDVLPKEMEMIPLGGHSFDMVGFRTYDGVVFLADCLASERTLEKYQISFLTDVEAYLDTLEKVKKMSARLFVPSHAQATENIAPLAEKNIDKVHEIGEMLADICREPQSFEEILGKVFVRYGLQMTPEQYALVGSTVRSYLAWLCGMGTLAMEIENNRMVWKKI